MVETVRVTVAPGGCVKIAPHPSGIAALGPLHLYAGASVTVPATEVERLYQRGDILHPATGQAKPRQAPPSGMTISVNGSRPMPADVNAGMMLDQASKDLARAHQEAQPPRFVDLGWSRPQPIPTIWDENRPFPGT